MNKDVLSAKNSKQVDELYEDMIVVGPGQMLSEARNKLSLSVEDIAEKLKFKPSLVAAIEQDIFDPKLPLTFNRGYLRSYAKLVNIDAEEVLSAYDMLGIAEVQRSEMQSFSNLTEKQAEHSRLMWLSYLIVAILFGLMVLWWQQTPKTVVPEEIKPIVEQIRPPSKSPVDDASSQTSQQAEPAQQTVGNTPIILPDTDLAQEKQLAVEKSVTTRVEQTDIDIQPLEKNDAEDRQQILDVSTATFTFSGDCWVNIYDATGERVAWGVKKMGYIMTVSGKPPLHVTL